VRLYESRGGRARSVVRPAFEWSKVAEVDLLEDDSPALDGRRALVEDSPSGELTVDLRPFQLVTLRLTPAGATG
jgi:alpha-mannosidase